MTPNLNFGIAFIGGLLTFFSPCFLPLVPAYLIYITGLSFEEIKTIRLKTIIHSLLFILGFSIVFSSMGLAASLLGSFFFNFQDILRIVGGGLIIVLGLYLIGVIKLPFLDMERKITISAKPSGYIGTLFVGMVFALGWSPCVGPILAGILLLAGQTTTAGQGLLMLLAFSAGLGLPLFLVSLGVNYFLSFIKKIEKHLKTIHLVCGIFLVLVGILLVTDSLQTITLWLIELTNYQGI